MTASLQLHTYTSCTCITHTCTHTGSVVGDALTNHPDVRKLGFTGSTEVGKEIMRWCVLVSTMVALSLTGPS